MLFGDCNQLPPVGDTALYKSPTHRQTSIDGKAVYAQFTKVFFLKAIMRQSGNDQMQFRVLLQHLAVGQFTEDDYALISSRFIRGTIGNYPEFTDSIRIMAKNELINSYNIESLRKLQKPVVAIKAVHNTPSAAVFSSEDAQGLPSCLYLAVGTKVRLTKNLWTSQGLCNGTIVFEPNADISSQLPLCILVKFPSYLGPVLYDGAIPITPVTSAFKKGNKNFTRRQFPLQLSYAISIHRSQGLTLDRAVVDIGDTEFSLGLAYVAISRLRTLEGILLQPFPITRISSLSERKEFGLKKNNEFERLHSLSLL